MKALLYATDYSENSISALKMANYLRRKFRCKLYVLHVFDLSATFISTVSIAYARLEEAAFRDHHSRLLEFCVRHIGRDAQSDGVEILIEQHGMASHAILDKAAEHKAEMIVVGMKGMSPIRELLVGSTASALIEKSEIPVLTVPANSETGTIDTIVYATAFEEADIVAIQNISELAKTFDSRIVLIHISTQEEYAGEDQLQWFKEMLVERVAYEKLSIQLRFSDDIFTSINEFLEEENPQLLVMLEREGHSLITNLWHRDLVKRMKLNVNVPLMSFHKTHLLQKQED